MRSRKPTRGASYQGQTRRGSEGLPPRPSLLCPQEQLLPWQHLADRQLLPQSRGSSCSSWVCGQETAKGVNVSKDSSLHFLEPLPSALLRP